jgi:NAD-dependent dihydropyrimidine dehydrogenase PreA subunit
MRYAIAQPCGRGGPCADEWPVDRIDEVGWLLYIQLDECVGCGVCEPVRPAEAIVYEHDLRAT